MIEYLTVLSQEYSQVLPAFMPALITLNRRFYEAMGTHDKVRKELEDDLLSSYIMVIALLEMKPIGFAMIYLFPNNLELASAYVSPLYRHVGIWQQMNAILLGAVKELENKPPRIVAFPVHPGVNKTLRRLGFKAEDATDTDIYLDL